MGSGWGQGEVGLGLGIDLDLDLEMEMVWAWTQLIQLVIGLGIGVRVGFSMISRWRRGEQVWISAHGKPDLRSRMCPMYWSVYSKWPLCPSPSRRCGGGAFFCVMCVRITNNPFFNMMEPRPATGFEPRTCLFVCLHPSRRPPAKAYLSLYPTY